MRNRTRLARRSKTSSHVSLWGSPARETGSRLTLRDLSAASPVCMSSFHRRSQSAIFYGTAGWVIGGVKLCHKARIVCSPFYGSMSRVASRVENRYPSKSVNSFLSPFANVFTVVHKDFTALSHQQRQPAVSFVWRGSSDICSRHKPPGLSYARGSRICRGFARCRQHPQARAVPRQDSGHIDPGSQALKIENHLR